MKLKWGLIGILIGILSACQSSNQPMDITYPQPSINIPAEGQKPPIDSEVEIKTPVLKSDQIEEPINQTDENEERCRLSCECDGQSGSGITTVTDE